MRLRFLTLMLVATLLALFAPAVRATSMLPVNLADLVANSEKAFVGRVVAIDIVETDSGWGEYIAMEITEDLLGNAAVGETVSWVQARLGENSRIPGMPRFAVGETRLVFLAGKGLGTCFQAPYGLGQGAFYLQRDAASGKTLVRNEFSNADLATALNAPALAKRMTDLDPAAKTKSTADKAALAEATATQLRRTANLDLAFLKEAVAAARSFDKPAEELKDASAPPAKLLEAGHKH